MGQIGPFPGASDFFNGLLAPSLAYNWTGRARGPAGSVPTGSANRFLAHSFHPVPFGPVLVSFSKVDV